LLKPLQERCKAGLSVGIALAHIHEHADPPHALRLLRAHRGWPRSYGE
jgi:hypothetical protein